MIRCVIADKHTLLRECVRETLAKSDTIRVLADFGDAREAAEEAVNLGVDILLLDATIPGPNPYDAARWARQQHRTLRVIFLAANGEEEHVIEAVKAGADGVVELTASCAELQVAIERVHRGTKYMPAADRFIGNPAMVSKIDQLTPREREVFKLLAEGNTVKEIAIMLGISVKTVEVHKFNTYQKLGVHNKAQLVMYAIARRVVFASSILPVQSKGRTACGETTCCCGQPACEGRAS